MLSVGNGGVNSFMAIFRKQACGELWDMSLRLGTRISKSDTLTFILYITYPKPE